MPPRNRLSREDTGIVSFRRGVFFDEVFDYKPGECCTFLSPYGGGKTQIAFEALGSVVSPELPATCFIMKSEDETVAKFGKRYHFETVRDWPPSSASIVKGKLTGKRPPGYLLWPKETGNIDYDEWNQHRVFKGAIEGMYNTASKIRKGRKGPNIMFADETFSLEKELDLSRPLVRAWTKGRSRGNGLWAASQRPANISQYAYQAQHLFLGYDADKRAQDRYAEIGGGFDPEVIKSLLNSLQRYEFLYISREEREMCIIEAN